VQEAHIEKTPAGQVPVDGGWFILNLGGMAWETVPGFGIWCGFDGPEHDSDTPGIGVHVHVLQPGEAPGYYHAEEAGGVHRAQRRVHRHRGRPGAADAPVGLSALPARYRAHHRRKRR
jgi:hypothetical protein